MEELMNFYLLTWYPLIVLGLYLWTSFLHNRDNEILVHG